MRIKVNQALKLFILGLCFAEQGKAPSFRLDKQALEATTARQLQVWAGHIPMVHGSGLGMNPKCKHSNSR